MNMRLMILACGLAFLLSGCGAAVDGPDRSIVTGIVTYDGEPVETGQIWFLPAAGREAPQAGAAIVKGIYRVENKGGVPLGSCTVKITAERPEEGVKIVADGGPEDIPMQQYLPPKYNEKTELTADIVASAEPVVVDFELKP